MEEAKPDLPDDDVYIENLFKLKKYSLIEAINFHKEYHHPSVFNNVDAPIIVRIEFNMVAKKKVIAVHLLHFYFKEISTKFQLYMFYFRHNF